MNEYARTWLWRGLGAIVLGALLARWAWILLAPSATAAIAAPVRDAAASARLFGAASLGDAGQSVSLAGARLIGVFTGPHGFAMLALQGKHEAGYALGEEVAPGVKLAQIGPDYAVLEQGGVRQRIALEGSQQTDGLVQSIMSQKP